MKEQMIIGTFIHKENEYHFRFFPQTLERVWDYLENNDKTLLLLRKEETISIRYALGGVLEN